MFFVAFTGVCRENTEWKGGFEVGEAAMQKCCADVHRDKTDSGEV